MRRMSTPKPVIICISANGMGAGKTTFSRALRDELNKAGNYQWAAATWTMSFASPLKRLCEDIFGWDGVKDEKGRLLLQEIGVAARHYQVDFWVERALARVKVVEEVPFIIFDDARFPNESACFRDAGYTVLDIHVVRNFDEAPMCVQHESEGYVPENAFATIPNSGSYDQFVGHAKELAAQILARQKND